MIKSAKAGSSLLQKMVFDGVNRIVTQYQSYVSVTGGTLQRGTLNEGNTGISGTPTWEEDFTFDPTGNWNEYVTKVAGTINLTQSRTHNTANEILTLSGASIQQNAAGNITKAPKPSGWGSAFILTYDAWNRLVKVKSGSSNVAIYGYDGLSRRTIKTSGGTTRHYYYTQQWQIIEERVGTSTSPDRQFVWGLMALDNLILRDRGTERFYAFGDYFSCTAIADTTGTVQERYGYNAFGQPLFMDASFTSQSSSVYQWETLFDSYRWDSETGFYQVRYRYLHPTLGRWLTRDPIRSNDDFNLYLYCQNTPKGQLDPLGLVSLPVVPCNPTAEKACRELCASKKLYYSHCFVAVPGYSDLCGCTPCSESERKKLKEEQDSQCKPSSCNAGMDCNQLKKNYKMNVRCIAARLHIMNKCYGGGNQGHKDQVDFRRIAAGNCACLMRKKGCT